MTALRDGLVSGSTGHVEFHNEIARRLVSSSDFVSIKAALVSGNSVIHVPAGNHTINSSIEIGANVSLVLDVGANLTLATGGGIALSGDGASLRGCGRNQIAVTDNSNRIVVSADDCELSGFVLTSLYTGAGPIGGGSIAVSACKRPLLRDVSVIGGCGIVFNGCSDIQVNRVSIRALTAIGQPLNVYNCTVGSIRNVIVRDWISPAGLATARAIFLNTSQDLIVSDCHVTDCDMSQSASGAGVACSASSDITLSGIIARRNVNCDGIAVEAESTDIIITGCNSSDNGNAAGVGQYYETGDGLDVYNSSHVNVNGCIFRNNGNLAGHEHIGTEIFSSDDVTLSDCDIVGSGAFGIGLFGARRIKVSGCNASESGWSGVYAAPQTGIECGDVMVGDCSIRDNNRAMNDQAIRTDGIYLAGETTAQIHGCRITDTRVTDARTQMHGVRIENLATAFITDNWIINNVVDQIRDSVGLSTLADNLVV